MHYIYTVFNNNGSMTKDTKNGERAQLLKRLKGIPPDVIMWHSIGYQTGNLLNTLSDANAGRSFDQSPQRKLT